VKYEIGKWYKRNPELLAQDPFHSFEPEMFLLTGRVKCEHIKRMEGRCSICKGELEGVGYRKPPAWKNRKSCPYTIDKVDPIYVPIEENDVL
jgi:hypothetical protein